MSELSPAVEELLLEGRPRALRALGRREALAQVLVGAAFLVVAVPLAVAAVGEDSPSLTFAAMLVAAYGLASRVELEVGSGYTVPTQLVFVPMLLVLPPGLAPLLVALGCLLGKLPDHLRRTTHPDRAILALGDAWYAVGPALVLISAGSDGVDWALWPIYLAALGSQFAFDAAASTAREWLAHDVAPALHLRQMGLVWSVDALLAPVGLLAAFAAIDEPLAVLLPLPLLGLIVVFARERAVRIEGALQLSHAYRGTAQLLGQVVESDDKYTGEHSRDVVALSLAVADELGLDARDRRSVEFTALLHDVGKISIPKEIINKPGPLDDEEWRLMRTHTCEGERLLEGVGGAMEEVGRLVRSSHERWDGRGYPDGLAADEIPLAACIVSCCDAFSAMTTDRSYRSALPLETALAELRENAGSQFHPRVAEVLAALVEHSAEQRAERPSEFALRAADQLGVA